MIMMMVSGSRKNAWPMMSMMLRVRCLNMLFTMSMRMCSLSSSVHDATIRNTAPNSTHCSSSQELDETSKSLRMMAFTADTITAARMSHARILPMRKLIASMTRLTPRSIPTLAFPLRAAPLLAHPARCPSRSWRRNCRSLASFARPPSTESWLRGGSLGTRVGCLGAWLPRRHGRRDGTPPHHLAMKRIEPAADNQQRPHDRIAIRHLTECQIAAQAGPDQQRVAERRDGRDIDGTAECDDHHEMAARDECRGD